MNDVIAQIRKIAKTMMVSRISKILANETGQMSIFIALLFQVLFVFFAMVVNIGMLVHDKINLQNAVDLAAYYGAQRQAEILNEIAHLNYQIRQDYKLLAWRYNVLGTLGRIGPSGQEGNAPPAMMKDVGQLAEKKYEPPYNADNDKTPAVCVNNPVWGDFLKDSNQPENYCFTPYGTVVPKIPDVVNIAPFVPGVTISDGFTKQAQAKRQLACSQAGPRNWAFSIQMLYAYKQSISMRKTIVWALRKNLADANFKDQQNNSVKDGVRKTLRKNLSKANESAFQDSGFEMLNGMSLGQCAQGDGAYAIPEILTAPTLLYVYNRNADCSPSIAVHQDVSSLNGAESEWDPNGQMKKIAMGEPEPTSPLASTLGFEKNPWCMAYVGVKAQTKPYKPFAPFGSPVTIEARGFAQPFGGRVGPWYRERWTNGSEKSSGGDRLDPLTTPRLLGTALEKSDDKQPLPNYSRFPGDKLGLTSAVSMGAQHKIFTDYRKKAQDERLKLEWFTQFDSIPKTGDPLATVSTSGDPFEGAAGPLRRAEVSAVAPDLFDLTYYSIDPRFYLNYASLGADRFQASGGGTTKPTEFPDIGGRIDGGPAGKYNVEQQITESLEKGFDQDLLGKLNYVVRDWQHLLNSWAPNRAVNYDFPEDRFAQCADGAKDELMIPGKCIVGGRVGYSVRTISRGALNSANWKIGGDGESPGAIVNPPSSDF